jgi:hypothetical protein
VFQNFFHTESPSIEVFQTFCFSHFVLKLCIFHFLSINSLLHVPPSLEGVELVEQRLLEKDFKEVFSFFMTLHNVHVLKFFVFLKLILSPLFWMCEPLIHNQV